MNDCLRNSTLLSWVAGNGVLLLARVYEKVLDEGEATDLPFDLSACDDLAVTATNGYKTEVLEWAIAQDENNCLALHIPHTLSASEWALEITCKRNGYHVRSFEFTFRIVETNCEAQTTFEVVDGCQSASVRVALQIVPQATVRGKNAYEMWRELPGNEDKTLQDYIDEVLDLHGRAADLAAATQRAEAASEAAEEAAAAIVNTDYVGEDNYVYHYNKEQGEYVKTDIYVKGDKGDKGDAFTYADFTPQQIAELKKPATDAASELAALEASVSEAESARVRSESTRVQSEFDRTQAERLRVASETNREEAETQRERDCAAVVAAANDAAMGAANVNAVLNGNTLTVTDRNGVSTVTNVKGNPGVGVPLGGSTGQVLVKKSGSDYDTEWAAESDPTVPSWAKTPTKPEYDYSEITNTPTISVVGISGKYKDLLDKPSIPTNTSDLNNNSGFITNSVNNLVNYYLKSETYTKTEVGNLLAAIQQFHYEIYVSTSDVASPSGNVLYLIGPTGTGSDKYEEYVYDSTKQEPWIKIGDTSIDLSGYVTITALNTALADYTTTANLTTLLAGKQNVIDTTHKLSADLVDDSNATNKFVTSNEKQAWNNKSDFSGSYNDLSDKPTIPTTLSQLSEDATHRTVSDTEKTTWGNKQESLVSGTNIKTVNNESLLGSGNISAEKPVVIEAPVNATDATLPVTALSCEVGKYYRLDVAVETLAITLPAMTDLTTVRTVVIYLTGGTLPAVTISSTAPSGGSAPAVYEQDGFGIESGKTYEVNCLWNGEAWIVGSIEVDVS